MKKEKRYYIWARCHHLYWCKDFRGYTSNIENAGQYTFDEVFKEYGERIANFNHRGEHYLIEVPECVINKKMFFNKYN